MDGWMDGHLKPPGWRLQVDAAGGVCRWMLQVVVELKEPFMGYWRRSEGETGNVAALNRRWLNRTAGAVGALLWQRWTSLDFCFSTSKAEVLPVTVEVPSSWGWTYSPLLIGGDKQHSGFTISSQEKSLHCFASTVCYRRSIDTLINVSSPGDTLNKHFISSP